MRRIAKFLVAGVLLAALQARAGDNDLELWRLGSPDGYSGCDNAACTSKTPVLPDLQAQVRFARLASALGLAFVPAFSETANTVGQSGFELGFSGQVAFLSLQPAEWATTGSQAKSPVPGALFLPTLRVRKGLGMSLELGTTLTYLTGSQMVALTGEVRLAPIDGVAWAPDLAVRAYGTRVVGTRGLDLTVGGLDFGLSKRFGVSGMVELQPYGELGLAYVNASSSVIDFRPDTEDAKNPTADDGVFRSISFWHNSYLRGTLGLRVVAGAVVLGLAGGLASGTNPVQQDAIQGGTVPTQSTRLWTASGHFGVSY